MGMEPATVAEMNQRAQEHAAAMDLDELSNGRLVLGLGSATRRMNEDWYGVPFSAPAPRMRELVELLRRLHSDLRASTSSAVSTTRSGVKPNLPSTSFSGAEEPNVCMPIVSPAGPT